MSILYCCNVRIVRCAMFSFVVGDPEDIGPSVRHIRSGTTRGEEAMAFIGPAMAMGRRYAIPSLTLPCLALDCPALPSYNRVAPLCILQFILVHCTCGMSRWGGANCCISRF